MHLLERLATKTLKILRCGGLAYLASRLQQATADYCANMSTYTHCVIESEFPPARLARGQGQTGPNAVLPPPLMSMVDQ